MKNIYPKGESYLYKWCAEKVHFLKKWRKSEWVIFITESIPLPLKSKNMAISWGKNGKWVLEYNEKVKEIWQVWIVQEFFTFYACIPIRSLKYCKYRDQCVNAAKSTSGSQKTVKTAVHREKVKKNWFFGEKMISNKKVCQKTFFFSGAPKKRRKSEKLQKKNKNRQFKGTFLHIHLKVKIVFQNCILCYNVKSSVNGIRYVSNGREPQKWFLLS